MAENEQAVAEEETPAAAEKAPANVDYIRVTGGKIATSLDISSMRKEWPNFKVGDTIELHFKIKEGEKHRIQLYTGNVISIRGEGLGKSFIVRRISHEIGVERIFPYHSPLIDKIKIIRKGKVRRAKLYYLRDKSGKAGRIKEEINYAAIAKQDEKKKAKAPAKKAVAPVVEKAPEAPVAEAPAATPDTTAAE